MLVLLGTNQRREPSEMNVTTIGIDLAKSVFQLRRHLGDPPRRWQHIGDRGLGTKPARAQTRPRRHSGNGKQDGTHRLGRSRTWRDLSGAAGSINLTSRRGLSSPRNTVRANVSDDDRTGPQPGKPEALSGLKSSVL